MAELHPHSQLQVKLPFIVEMLDFTCQKLWEPRTSFGSVYFDTVVLFSQADRHFCRVNMSISRRKEK